MVKRVHIRVCTDVVRHKSVSSKPDQAQEHAGGAFLSEKVKFLGKPKTVAER